MDKGYPFIKYRYQVYLGVGGIPNPVDTAFSSVKGLGYQRQITRVGNMNTLADKQTVELRTLELKRVVFGGDSPLTQAQVMQLPFFHERMLRYDMLISLMDAQGSPTTSWIVDEAYLESWDFDDLDANATGDSAVMMETMKFKYTSLTYDPFAMAHKLLALF